MAAGEIDEETYHKKLEKKFNKVMNPEKEAKKTEEELRAKTKEAQRANVTKLWAEFDADGDGKLSKEENRDLMRSYLDASKANYPNILKLELDGLLATYMKVAKAKIFMKMEKDENGKPNFMLRALMETYLGTFEADQQALNDKLLQKVMLKVVEQIESMETESDKIADELHSKMDLDHDGSVSKEEFEKSFCDLTDQVFDVTKVVDPIVALAQKDLDVKLGHMQEKATNESEKYQQKANIHAKQAHDEEMSRPSLK